MKPRLGVVCRAARGAIRKGRMRLEERLGGAATPAAPPPPSPAPANRDARRGPCPETHRGCGRSPGA